MGSIYWLLEIFFGIYMLNFWRTLFATIIHRRVIKLMFWRFFGGTMDMKMQVKMVMKKRKLIVLFFKLTIFINLL
jgi:hypothetical protein